MSVLNKIASSFNRRDEVPNQELANSIVNQGDNDAVKELVENLTNKKKDIQNDCIKVLYEIGDKNPALISSHMNNFLKLLNNKNNRLQWGAMMALNCIAKVNAKGIFTHLSEIIEASEKGSVITRDHAVNILITLCGESDYTESAFSLLIEQLHKAPTGQLPMYAERAMSVIDDKKKTSFTNALRARLEDIEKESKRKRVEKVIQKMS